MKRTAALEKPVTFWWNNRPLQGQEGEPLAAALIANGESTTARSFKYGRKRGISGYALEEACTLVTVDPDSPHQIPNVRATEVYLYEGLRAISATTARPSLGFDLRAALKPLHRFMPAGFYYKTFKHPARLWRLYEHFIRAATGFSRLNGTFRDPDAYFHRYDYCEVLVVGAGIAGLQVASSLIDGGARVTLVEHRPEVGGQSLAAAANSPARAHLQRLHRVIDHPNCRLWLRTLAYSYQDGLVLALENHQDHRPQGQRSGDKARQTLHFIRASTVILASGSTDRPLLFTNNDLPGIMLATAASRYLEQHQVLFAHRPVVAGNNDSIYDVARQLRAAGARVSLVDSRPRSQVAEVSLSDLAEIECHHGHALLAASGGGGGRRYRVTRVDIASVDWVDDRWQIGAPSTTLACDGIAVSGGFVPELQLYHQDGSRPLFDHRIHAFVPAAATSTGYFCGSVNGVADWRSCVEDATSVAQQVLAATRRVQQPLVPSRRPSLPSPLIVTGDNVFVDLQNDVKSSDIALAIRENYRSIEHIKRYTAIGFGTDQGKTSHLNAIAIAAEMTARSAVQVSTTTFRPPYAAVSFGAMAGGHHNAFFDARRYTPMDEAQRSAGAVWEQVGQWDRARYYPRPGEDMEKAVLRECLAVRDGVGMMDVSTLGKIDVRGKDARRFLSRVYTNSWHQIKPGRCRYGLMCDERGMILDDGVTTCLGDDHFYLTTTTGGAAHVYEELERWLQTEWPELDVYLTSVTDQWAAVAVAGPRARDLLQQADSDIDLSAAGLPFMRCVEGCWDAFQARIMRVSFSGELSFEINVPADQGLALWQRLVELGDRLQITPYGTEAMHVLRAEKGFIIVGQDTDGSNTPADMGLDWMVKGESEVSFVGERSLRRSDMLRADRKQLVGLRRSDGGAALPEGSALIAEGGGVIGHITSSYNRTTLGFPIALGMLSGGRSRMGHQVRAQPAGAAKGCWMEVCSPVFYDPEGKKARA